MLSQKRVFREKEENTAVEERLHIFSLLLVSQQPVNHQVIMRERERRIRMIYSFRPLPLMKRCARARARLRDKIR